MNDDQVHALVSELETLSESGGPGAKAAWFKLLRLAETTGKEWDDLVLQYWNERTSSNGTEE